MIVILPRIIGACRTFRSACLFLCLALAVLAPAGSAAADGYLGELQQRAKEKDLARARTWEVLLHYKPSGKGIKSLVDDPRFFLAPDGRRDPDAELFATLAAFFQETVKDDEEHPRCRFIARYTWLREELAIDEQRLPKADCAKFEKALAAVNPRSVVLVFPNTLLNLPSSMFGHTLLRLNTQYESDLLSHAVNYAAITGDNLGLFYVVKGIFGFYHGRFSNLPYFEKVREYSDLEHRDIWEYHLNLTPDEAYRVFLHIWEMKDHYANYYFFDQNCSFNLLFLIEAGRPSLRLTDEFYGKSRFWVIPVDTVRAAQKFGIIDKVTYRPSRATKILRIAEDMDSGLMKLTDAVVRGERKPGEVLFEDLRVEDKRAVLDLSAELTQYKFSGRKLEQEKYQQQFLDILASRSTLGTPDGDPYPIVTPTPPDEGHLSGRFRTGGGYRTGSWFAELEWRAAYHDITDLDEGYVRGAQINFMDLSFRYYFDEDKLRLHRWHVIDIVSLSPWDGIFKPVSWKVNGGIEEVLLRDGREHPVPRLNAGAGITAGVGRTGRAYLLAETDLQAGTRLEKDYAVGFGGTAGLMTNVTKDWKMNLWTRALFYGAGDGHRTIAAGLQQTYRFTTNRSLSLDVLRERTYDIYRTDITARMNWYY
ncbi:MAG: Lnb N-terminal periplasmic domain-containing protein [Nitrospirota bacterium]